MSRGLFLFLRFRVRLLLRPRGLLLSGLAMVMSTYRWVTSKALHTLNCCMENGVGSEMRTNKLASLEPPMEPRSCSLLQVRQKKFSSRWPVWPSCTEGLAL